LVFLFARQYQAHLQTLMGVEMQASGFPTGSGIAAGQRLTGASWTGLGDGLTRHGRRRVEVDVARKRRHPGVNVGPIAGNN